MGTCEVLTLKQLREQQKADGVKPEVAPSEDFDSAPAQPRQLWTRVVHEVRPGAYGYLRLLPPGKTTVAQLGGEWVAENWDKASPWCRIEGEPVHPEFENNLKIFELAP